MYYYDGIIFQSNVNGLVMYNIPCTSSLKIPYAFGILEKAREAYQLEDYWISQTTLERVVISNSL